MKLGNSRDDEVAEQVTRLRCGEKNKTKMQNDTQESLSTL